MRFENAVYMDAEQKTICATVDGLETHFDADLVASRHHRKLVDQRVNVADYVAPVRQEYKSDMQREIDDLKSHVAALEAR